MEKIELTAQVRDKAGKGIARGLRRNAKIPAVLYSHGNSMPLAMGYKDITKVLNTEGGEHALITLRLEGAKDAAERLALIKDYQVDPINGSPIHVDLMEVALDEEVRVSVSVHITGSSLGVKEGGILQHGVRELEVECLPNQIPDVFNVDISQLKLNESLHVRDIQVPEGVTILTEPEATLATIQPPVSQEKLDAMLSTAPVVEEGAEPDLVQKAKEEAPAAEGKEKEAAPKK